jgi:AmmeMemoRadiSam system protein A
MLPPPKIRSQNEPAVASNGQLCAPEFGEDARNLLLAVAHNSILASLDNREIDLAAPLPQLAQARGVFTTLYLHGVLRGCVGYVMPAMSLYRAVAESARVAAFEDTRFAPVSHGEAPALEVSLSILALLHEITAGEVEVGRHGLLISQDGKRGLLLPQVPVEHGWDRVTFLEQTCRKAGLPNDAWANGARIEAFTAEVFGDPMS